MNTQEHKEKLHTNHRRLVQKFTGEKGTQMRKTQKLVDVFFDALIELFHETQGGVHLDDFGYFCHIKSPKRRFDRKGNIYRPQIPYLFSDLSIRGNFFRKWSMEGHFKEEFNTTKDYTLHYTTVKGYKRDK